MYLGVFFNYNGPFVRHKTHLVGQSKKAMFALLKKSKELDLPIDLQVLQLELFDSLILPILLYGYEVCGHENVFLYLKYLKYVLCLKQSTLCLKQSTHESKLSSRFHNLLCHYSANSTLSSKGLETIKHMGKARHFKTFPQANIKKSTSH